MELLHHHPPKEVSSRAMVLPRPGGGHQHRRPLPFAYSEDQQPRPPGERHPKEANPLPLRARPRLSHTEKASRECPQALPASPPQKALALHRLNERVDALAIQTAFAPHAVARLGHPRLLGLAIDWTMFDAYAALRREDALPGLARSRPEEGTCVAAGATGLRPRPPAGRKEPEPARAGRPACRSRGAARGRPPGRFGRPRLSQGWVFDLAGVPGPRLRGAPREGRLPDRTRR